MGNRTSGILLVEIFLQHMNNQHSHIIAKPNVRLLAWNVDNVLVIFDSSTTNENHILNIPNNGKFPHEKEIYNIINYSDLTIEKSYKRKY